jgi:hypothetical protein
MFEENLEEPEYDFFNFTHAKAPAQTCNTLRHGNSSMSPAFRQECAFPEALDLSIDCHLYHNNALILREHLLHYLRHCLDRDLLQHNAFTNGQIFGFPSSHHLDQEADSALDTLVHDNRLLSEPAKKIMLQNFKEFHELNGLFSELHDLLGPDLTQELIFILSTVFQKKIPQFR